MTHQDTLKQAVAEEYAMSGYASHRDRDADMIDEIARLRAALTTAQPVGEAECGNIMPTIAIQPPQTPAHPVEEASYCAHRIERCLQDFPDDESITLHRDFLWDVVQLLRDQPPPSKAQEGWKLGEVKAGGLTTFNQDEYPGLGDWWVQIRIGEGFKEVLARVYGDSPEEARSRAAAVVAMLTAAPQAPQGDHIAQHLEMVQAPAPQGAHPDEFTCPLCFDDPSNIKSAPQPVRPPKPVALAPLTDEEAQKIFHSEHCNISKELAGILARAIANGITGDKQ